MNNTMIPENEKGKVLLPIARAAIAEHFGHEFDHDTIHHADWLHEHGACFVTLMQHDILRGFCDPVQGWRAAWLHRHPRGTS